MCGVYRRFASGFAKVATPPNALTSTHLSKDLSPLTEETQQAFDTLRELLLNPPILAIPGEGAHYTVEVDASYDQLKCALLQQ